MFRIAFFCFVFFFLIQSESVRAGQLYVEWYSLAGVAVAQGSVFLGTVLAVHGNKIKIKIKENWTKKNDFLGKEKEFEIYQGVEWKNPNKSPMDQRLIYGASIKEIRPGEEIFVTEKNGVHEVLLSNSLNRRKVEYAFEPEKKAAYIRDAKLKVLCEDLKDEELGELTLRALRKRNAFKKSELIEALRGEGKHEAVKGLILKSRLSYERLNFAEIHQLLASGVQALQFPRDWAVGMTLAESAVTRLSLEKDGGSDRVKLLQVLPRLLSSILLEGSQQDFAQASAFVGRLLSAAGHSRELANSLWPGLVYLQVNRTEPEQSDDKVKRFLKYVDDSSKSKIALGVLKKVFLTKHRTQAGSGENVDRFLIDFASRLVVESSDTQSSKQVIEEIVAIDRKVFLTTEELEKKADQQANADLKNKDVALSFVVTPPKMPASEVEVSLFRMMLKVLKGVKGEDQKQGAEFLERVIERNSSVPNDLLESWNRFKGSRS